MNEEIDMADLIKEWTDGDLQCCISKESDTCYVYAEVRYIAPDEYIFCASEVDITDYSKEQLEEEFITQWYPYGINEVQDTYKDKANQIIAECIFESLAESEMDYSSEEIYRTEDEAAKALKQYVNEYK